MFILIKLCRLCTANQNVSSSLSDLDSDNLILLDKLNAITPGILEPGNELPNGICTTCVIHLNQAYKFINNCIKAQEVLKQYLKHSEIENSECKVEEIKLEDTSADEKQINVIKNCKNVNFESIYVKCEQESDYEDKIDELKFDNSITEQVKSSVNEIVAVPSSSKIDNQCHVCGKAFSKKSNLITHVRSLHKKEKPFRCELCGKVFSKKQSLQVHIRTHTNEKPYNCDICKKGFTQSTHLKSHIRVHTDGKLYKCEICEKVCMSPLHYENHMRSHTVDKPFKCTTCEKAFARSYNLKEHILTHTKLKPFECKLCGKAFRRRDHLKGHIRTHTKERNYRCPICSKAFTQSSSLNVHVRRHDKYLYSSSA